MGPMAPESDPNDQQSELMIQQTKIEIDPDSELSHYRKVTTAFDEYRKCSLNANNKRRQDFYRISMEEQRLLPNYIQKLEEIDDRIRRNADVLDEIVFKAELNGPGPIIKSTDDEHHNEENHGISAVSTGQINFRSHSSLIRFDHLITLRTYLSAKPTPVLRQDSEKVRSTLRQFVRDWSSLGEPERRACYEPILSKLDDHCQNLVSVHGYSKDQIRVLVPGSGLGRLLWEVANRGYTAQGNEFSYYMLLASNLVLNHNESINQWSIYPFIHSLSNLTNYKNDILREIQFPDVLTSKVLNSKDFGISVGDFIEIFSKSEEKDNWNVVITCFFIDTSQNIIKYLKNIYNLLKKGGIWINLGPTLWHFENSHSSNSSLNISIELDILEIKDLCLKIGFEFLHEDTIRTTYANNPNSNLQNVYNAHFWVGVKN